MRILQLHRIYQSTELLTFVVASVKSVVQLNVQSDWQYLTFGLCAQMTITLNN